MGRVRFTAEQIIGKLREAELLLGQGMSIGAGVKYLLEQLQKNPPAKIPANPAEPDRSKWFEKEIK